MLNPSAAAEGIRSAATVTTGTRTELEPRAGVSSSVRGRLSLPTEICGIIIRIGTFEGRNRNFPRVSRVESASPKEGPAMMKRILAITAVSALLLVAGAQKADAYGGFSIGIGIPGYLCWTARLSGALLLLRVLSTTLLLRPPILFTVLLRRLRLRRLRLWWLGRQRTLRRSSLRWISERLSPVPALTPCDERR